MNYRMATLLAAEDLGASGTKVIDIDVNKPISRITLTFKTSRNAHAQSYGGPADISRIEIVDGSTRLASLTGYECQALAYYNRPSRTFGHRQSISQLSQVEIFPIDFGRFLWDPVLAFDPLKFSNPQLRITWNEATSDTTVTSNEAEVWADIFDEKVVSPIGFLSPIEHYSYTCGADNSYEHITLPDDRPFRQILVRANYAGYEPWYNIDEARFDEGTLDKIVFEYTNLEVYYRRMKSVWPLIVEQFAFIADTGTVQYYVPMSDYYCGIVASGLNATTEVFISGTSARGGKLLVDASANTNALGLIFGYLPWHTYQFPLGLQDVIDDWYDPAGKKPRLRLRAATGATNVDAQVVLEELYKY